MKRFLFALFVLKAITLDFSLYAQQWVTEIDSDRSLSFLSCVPVDNGNAVLSVGSSKQELQESVDVMGGIVKVRADGTYTRREIRKAGKKLHLLTATALDNGNYMVMGAFDDSILDSEYGFFRHLTVMVLDSSLATVSERTYRVDTDGFEGFRPVRHTAMKCTRAADGNVVLGTVLSYFTPDQYGGKYESRFRFYELNPDGDTLRSSTQPQILNGRVQSGQRIENLFPNPQTGGFTFVGIGNYSNSGGNHGVWNLSADLRITSNHPMLFGSHPIYFAPTKMTCEGHWYDNGRFLAFIKKTTDHNTHDPAGWLYMVDTLAGKHASVLLPPLDSVNNADFGCCTAYVDDSTVFAATYCFPPNVYFGSRHTSITLLDNDLNVLGRKPIYLKGLDCFPTVPVALDDGSVIIPIVISSEVERRHCMYSFKREDIEITWDVVPDDTHESREPAFPNPARDRLNIPVEGILPGTTRLRLVSSDGTPCVDAPITAEGAMVVVDVANLDPGLYVYQIVTNGRTNASGKFIKE